MIGLGFLPLLVQEAPAGQAALRALEARLRLTNETRVGHRLAVGVGEIGGDAHIDPYRRARGEMTDAPLYREDNLGLVAIRPAQQPHALDLVKGEGGQIA